MNQVERKAYDKAYYIAHKKDIAARHRAYRLSHKKEKDEYSKAYRLANKERIKASRKAARLAGTDYYKTYRLAHKKVLADWQRTYRRKYPEKPRVLCRKYRALKRGNSHEPYAETYIYERDGWICGICGRKINKRLKRPNLLSKSIDHIIPLSKGGADAPTNVQAAHLRCNMIKQAQSGGQLRLIC